MPKFNVVVYRTETYYTNMNVEAETEVEALAIAEEAAYEHEDQFHWKFFEMEMDSFTTGEGFHFPEDQVLEVDASGIKTVATT